MIYDCIDGEYDTSIHDDCLHHHEYIIEPNNLEMSIDDVSVLCDDDLISFKSINILRYKSNKCVIKTKTDTIKFNVTRKQYDELVKKYREYLKNDSLQSLSII